jgi:hypothetical protein
MIRVVGLATQMQKMLSLTCICDTLTMKHIKLAIIGTVTRSSLGTSEFCQGTGHPQIGYRHISVIGLKRIYDLNQNHSRALGSSVDCLLFGKQPLNF